MPTSATDVDQIPHLPPAVSPIRPDPEPATGPAAGRGGAPSAAPFTARDSHAMIELILRRRDELVEVLTGIATRHAAADELNRSIATLAGAQWEVERNRPRTVDELAVFLPSNNVFYSYVLFAVVPSLYCRKVLVRPSSRSTEVSRALHRILTTDPATAGLLDVEFLEVSQRSFLRRCAAADVVVFNGRPENAEELAARLPRSSMLLAFGSGPNPVVVGPDAALRTVVEDLLRVRMYNSGQDCLCPDLVLADERIADDLVENLRDGVAGLRVGARSGHDTDVGPLVYPDAVEQIERFLAAHRDHVVAGGRVDRATGLVEPTVLDMPWDPRFHPPEFFGPVLCVMRYRHPDDVGRWLNSPTELARGMYVSVYGEEALDTARIGSSVVTRDCMTLDVECGNQPLGGFGHRAGHVRVDGVPVARPLLLSAELGARTACGTGRR
ncbi:MAG TPA: aldehyde dehydrogenase family protein [Pseudonocardia sp.]|nr:aldehyde dehydrogenase family protein [Pseudonocardia sp.]